MNNLTLTEKLHFGNCGCHSEKIRKIDMKELSNPYDLNALAAALRLDLSVFSEDDQEGAEKNLEKYLDNSDALKNGFLAVHYDAEIKDNATRWN